MDYKFCPKCGGELKNIKCTRCGFVFYKNSKPTATGVIVENGKALITIRRDEPKKGFLNLPGGFLESGEHPVAGLLREMEEELKIKVEPKHFLGFFMDNYAHEEISYDTLNMAWICQIKFGTPVASDDAIALEWVDLENLPQNLAFKCDREILEATKFYLNKHGI